MLSKRTLHIIDTPNDKAPSKGKLGHQKTEKRGQ